MRVEFAHEKLDGGTLYTLLNKHHLLPSSLEDPLDCMMFADRATIGFLYDDDKSPNPLAILLETQPEPWLVGIMMITERARLNQRRDELIEVSKSLRERWFNEMQAQRVETRFPVERTQTLRCFKHMGFRMETIPSGLRGGAVYNGRPVSLCVMSLLPSDPIKELSKSQEEPKLTDEVEQ